MMMLLETNFIGWSLCQPWSAAEQPPHPVGEVKVRMSIVQTSGILIESRQTGQSVQPLL